LKGGEMVKGKGMLLKNEPENLGYSANTQGIIDAIKELTMATCEHTKILKTMKASHDKWVRAGKF
jgi:hypothetical protein